jgi:hypothetical protein
MKTIEAIRGIEEDLRKELSTALKNKDKKASTLTMRKLEKMKTYRLYMESTPRQEYLEKVLKELQTRLAHVDEGFPAWSIGRCGDKQKLWAQYYADMGVSMIKAKIETIKFLLD